MLLERAKIYGVDGAGGEDPRLIRTENAAGLSWSYGENGEIYSDFDRCYPWCDMIEVEDDERNVFIRIPKFYSRITENADGTYKYQISGTRYEGFTTLFVDGYGQELDYVLVGKYEAELFDNGLRSRSNAAVCTSKSIDGSNGLRSAVPKGYQLYDIWIDAMIKQLFLIEFATTDCQSVMAGWTNVGNSASLLTGHTDGIKTPSGSFNASSGTGDHSDGLHACKYRGIENPWGNTWTLVDGIRFVDEKTYVCYDPAHYAEIISSDNSWYKYVGNRSMPDNGNGYVQKVEPFPRIPALAFVTNAMGSAHYYSDRYYASAGTRVLAIGGWAGSGKSAGLWCMHSSIGGNSVGIARGARLCYKPV